LLSDVVGTVLSAKEQAGSREGMPRAGDAVSIGDVVSAAVGKSDAEMTVIPP